MLCDFIRCKYMSILVPPSLPSVVTWHPVTTCSKNSNSTPLKPGQQHHWEKPSFTLVNFKAISHSLQPTRHRHQHLNNLIPVTANDVFHPEERLQHGYSSLLDRHRRGHSISWLTLPEPDGSIRLSCQVLAMIQLPAEENDRRG